MTQRSRHPSRFWAFVDACIWWIAMALTYLSIVILLTGRLAVRIRRFLERRVRREEPEF